ncbi:hypothetical protein ACYCSE_23995 [Paenibacillus sp. SEL1]
MNRSVTTPGQQFTTGQDSIPQMSTVQPLPQMSTVQPLPQTSAGAASYPTTEQINQLNYLNSNPHLLVDYVAKQKAGQNPPLPGSQTSPPYYLRNHNFPEIPYRTLTASQRINLVSCFGSPKFTFIITGISAAGPMTAHLMRVTSIAPDFMSFSGIWLDPSDGFLKFNTFFDAFTQGVAAC